MSLTEIFQTNVAVTQVPHELADEVLQQTRQQHFVVSQDYRSTEFASPMITKWDADMQSEVIQAHNCPPYFQSLWNRLLSFNQFAWFQGTFGNFTQGSVIVNKYRKGDGMDWHYDVPDSTFLQVLLYLSTDIFDESDGGTLEVGMTEVNSMGLFDKDAVNRIKTVLPNHGTLVTIMNLNPTVVHRVIPLKADKERLTVVLRYGYLSNLFTLKKWRVMKGLEHA